MLQVYSHRYSKDPDHRRRSFWSRLFRRRARFVFAVLMANVAIGLVVYSTLRASGRLPSQVRARRENEAFDRWVRHAAFQRDVTRPLEEYLVRNLPTDTELDTFGNWVRSALRFDPGMPPIHVAPTGIQSPLIRRWRAILAQLDERGIRVYGSTAQLSEGEAWLRRYLETRAPARANGVDLRPLLQREAFVEVAMGELTAQLQVGRDELNGILFVASGIERQRAGK